VLLIKFSTEHAKNYASMKQMGMEMREKYIKACPGTKLLSNHLRLLTISSIYTKRLKWRRIQDVGVHSIIRNGSLG